RINGGGRGTLRSRGSAAHRPADQSNLWRANASRAPPATAACSGRIRAGPSPAGTVTAAIHTPQLLFLHPRPVETTLGHAGPAGDRPRDRPRRNLWRRAHNGPLLYGSSGTMSPRVNHCHRRGQKNVGKRMIAKDYFKRQAKTLRKMVRIVRNPSIADRLSLMA